MEPLKKTRKINAARICFGISRIGYTPATAICDIIDNAVSAHAKNIHIKIIQKDNSSNLNKKNNVEQYLIVDDGDGMNKEKIENALDLGSNESYYSEKTLSKFGLGLKSASFAQGNRLEVISGDCTGEIHKEYVDLDEIDNEYYSVECDLEDSDKYLVDKYFDNNKGTIIRISKIHTNNHPSIKSTISELKDKLGVIYYYFLKNDLHIYINDEEISAVDALFTEEAGDYKLDENEWDGKSVQWILKPIEIILDPENEVKGKIEITMLPHPKVRKNEGISDADIRKKYHISASNYGFYVYRNGRLINWANRLDNIIPQDQDFYAFRGRINIQDNADDAFNIDVSKSNIILSEDAKTALDDYILDHKNKCRKAWQNAYNKYKAQISEDSNEISNDIAIGIGDTLDTPTYDEEDPIFNEEIKKREQHIIDEIRNKEKLETCSRIKYEGIEDKTEENITNEDIAKTMKGSTSLSDQDYIFKVPFIQDNVLWEPYVDADYKNCVRISSQHRFAKVIYENNNGNKALQILIELMLLIAAKVELIVRKNCKVANIEQITKIFEDYRREISEKLATLCREKEDELPPNIGE